MASSVVNVSLKFTNPKALKALRVIVKCLMDVGEDFEYRDDVKRAIKAAKYLAKNTAIVASQDRTLGTLSK